jgi:hypothetical protein
LQILAITIQPNADYSVPLGSDGFEPTSNAQNLHSSNGANESSAIWDFADMSDHEGGIPTAASEWSTGPSDARQGLYWFWDPSWDQMYNDIADWP